MDSRMEQVDALVNTSGTEKEPVERQAAVRMPDPEDWATRNLSLPRAGPGPGPDVLERLDA